MLKKPLPNPMSHPDPWSCHPWIGIILLLPTHLGCLSLLFLNFPAGTSSAMLSRSSQNRRSSLVPGLWGKALSLSPLSVMFLGSLHWGSSLLFLQWEGVVFPQMLFLNLWGRSLQSINLVSYINWFSYVEHNCVPGTNHTWPRCVILLICYWIWFASPLWRIFATMLIKAVAL